MRVWTAVVATLTITLAGLVAAPEAVVCQTSPASAQAAGRLLTGKYGRDVLARTMLPAADWKPFPPAADRAAWDGLLRQPVHQARRDWIVKSAERLLGQPWPALPATLYMEFARTGNRDHYETPYFARRERLAMLVLAECFEHRGRFLDEIANGLWAIGEEATWCLPAHAARLPKDVLHRQDLESVDLFAAETAMTLATARYLLRAELEQLSPALSDRVRREVLRRVVDPVAAGDTFGRSSWLNGYNNWAPWCASNVLGAAMFLVDDPGRLAALTFRMMEVADRFVDRYGDDGGCDEGPGYWNEAGGALLVLLELLHSRTDGTIDIYAHPKIAAMGSFIVNAHIAGPWFINFSDADAKTVPHPGKVYRYGERTNQPALKDLAFLAMRSWKAGGAVDPPLQMSGVSRAMLGPLMEMFWIPADARPGRASLPAATWMPDIQMLVARERPDAPHTGLFLSARGGHNAESHNHNDVGNFVVYLDGQPGVIDVGRETYTAQTFSSGRYDLWFTRGASHNAPIVNGVEQKDGREFQASSVEFRDGAGGPYLTMNLERAYPAEAGLQSIRREIDMGRTPAASVTVRDRWTLAKGPGRIRYTFYTVSAADSPQPGQVVIHLAPRKLLLDYEPAAAKVQVERVPLADPIMRGNWGPELHRIVVDLEAPAAGTCVFRFRAGE